MEQISAQMHTAVILPFRSPKVACSACGKSYLTSTPGSRGPGYCSYMCGVTMQPDKTIVTKGYGQTA